MSLFKDGDTKKAIRAFVSSAKGIEFGSPAKDTTKQAGSVPYVAPKRQVSMPAVLQRSPNFPNKKTSGT
eukprot:7905918-Ditylum_brightwellii.AAC.2